MYVYQKGSRYSVLNNTRLGIDFVLDNPPIEVTLGRVMLFSKINADGRRIIIGASADNFLDEIKVLGYTDSPYRNHWNTRLSRTNYELCYP